MIREHYVECTQPALLPGCHIVAGVRLSKMLEDGKGVVHAVIHRFATCVADSSTAVFYVCVYELHVFNMCVDVIIDRYIRRAKYKILTWTNSAKRFFFSFFFFQLLLCSVGRGCSLYIKCRI
jgi:hypothetical protein